MFHALVENSVEIGQGYALPHRDERKVKFEGSLARMCVSRWALMDVLKESIVLGAQMDGDSELWRRGNREDSSIIHGREPGLGG